MPTQELALPTLTTLLAANEPNPGFAEYRPGVGEFFFDPLFGTSGPFAVNRVVLLTWLVAGLICLFFGLGSRRAQMVPRGTQNVMESVIDFVRRQIAFEAIGEAGNKFLLYVGVKEQGLGHYFKNMCFPPGVPKPIYLFVAPLELVSTLVVRPLTLTVRLLANLVAGHLILSVFAYASSYILLYNPGVTKVFAVGSISLSIAFTGFEILVAFLQAYIFTLLTAVYLAGSLEPEH